MQQPMVLLSKRLNYNTLEGVSLPLSATSYRRASVHLLVASNTASTALRSVLSLISHVPVSSCASRPPSPCTATSTNLRSNASMIVAPSSAMELSGISWSRHDEAAPRGRLPRVRPGAVPLLSRLRPPPLERQLHAHDHALRPLRGPSLEPLEDDPPLLGAGAHRLILHLLDRAHVGGLRHADLAVVDLQAQLRHQRRLDVAHHLLRLLVAGGEHRDLAHLAQRGHHHPGREDPGEAGDQVLGALHPPRIGRLGRGRQGQRIAVLRALGIGRGHAQRSPVATWFRPDALARYSARSAATSTSSVSGPRPGTNSATPTLTVTSPSE